MKPLLLSLVAALAFFLSTNASIKTIDLSYQTTDFNVVQYGGVAHIDTYKYIPEFLTDTLSPALPWIPVYVLIHPNQSVAGVSCQSTLQLMNDNIVVARCELPISTNETNRIFHPNYTPAYPAL